MTNSNLFLLYRDPRYEDGKNANGIHAAVIAATGPDHARKLAVDAAPDGETRVHDCWQVRRLAKGADVPDGDWPEVIFLRGDVVV